VGFLKTDVIISPGKVDGKLPFFLHRIFVGFNGVGNVQSYNRGCAAEVHRVFRGVGITVIERVAHRIQQTIDRKGVQGHVGVVTGENLPHEGMFFFIGFEAEQLAVLARVNAGAQGNAPLLKRAGFIHRGDDVSSFRPALRFIKRQGDGGDGLGPDDQRHGALVVFRQRRNR